MISQEVEVPTEAGTVDALLTRPDTAGPLPGVLQLTDGLGLRPAHAELSACIADHGFVVLTPNIFYRTTRPPAFTFEVDFTSERSMNRSAPRGAGMRGRLPLHMLLRAAVRAGREDLP